MRYAEARNHDDDNCVFVFDDDPDEGDLIAEIPETSRLDAPAREYWAERIAEALRMLNYHEGR